MFKKRFLSWLLTAVIGLTVLGCKSNYEKLRAGKDVTQKYQEAIRLYNNKRYVKALPLFDDLMQYYRGTSEAKDLIYYTAYTNYKLKDYLTARHQFKLYAENYPSSSKAEECLYMAAYCYYLESPSYRLDQENTHKAIEAMQLFVSIYPKSTRAIAAQEVINTLHEKLEKKAYFNAKMYYEIGDYKSAVLALINTLREYPSTKYREEIQLLTIKAWNQYAKNSTEVKQEERYKEAISCCNDFINKYPDSKLLHEVEQEKKIAEKGIASAKQYVLENKKEH